MKTLDVHLGRAVHGVGMVDCPVRDVSDHPLPWPDRAWQLVQADPMYALVWRHRETGAMILQAGYSDLAVRDAHTAMREYEATP